MKTNVFAVHIDMGSCPDKVSFSLPPQEGATAEFNPACVGGGICSSFQNLYLNIQNKVVRQKVN